MLCLFCYSFLFQIMLKGIWSVGIHVRSRTLIINNLIRTLYSTGIEHAKTMKETGMKKKMNPEEYKCSDYFNFQKYSYCDIEAEVIPKRMPQPSNKKPDEERKAKP
uniref:Complex I-9kD n=2 Tax=Wuchereria bancrofti TaxID=6293 RepID=A0A1I8EHD6_WUCBA